MKFTFDHDYHIHSMISLCSGDAEQTPERILDYAEANGLKRLVITDHYWDESVPVNNPWYEKQDTEYLKHWLPLPQRDGIELLYGCEVDMDRDYNIGISPERYDDFDFIIVPTTHMHTTFTVPDEAVHDNVKRAKVWIDRLDAVLNKDLPFHKIGIAHLTCGLLALNRDDYREVLSLIPDDELVRLFTKAAEKGCGIELNAFDMKFTDVDPELVLRFYRIAKKCGCKFYLGSDSHHPVDLDAAKDLFERAIDMLNLTEDDKFIIKR